MVEHHHYDQTLLQSLVEIVQRHISDENFGARELAEEAGIRQRKLSQKVQALTRKSVSGLICEIRLKKALEMLQQEDLTVAEVAYKVGFGSATYFNKCFHEYFGCTPGKIKEGDQSYLKILNSAGQRPGSGARKTVFKTTLNVSVAVVVLILLLLVLNHFYITGFPLKNSSKIPKESEVSIAVLPFKNLSDEVADQYFLDGIRDEINSDLCKIHSLIVISRISTEKYRRTLKSSSKIGNELNVRYIVSGSGQKKGSFIMLRVQLTDIGANREIWADSYTKEINETSDLFDIQNQIAGAIASELNTTISPSEKELIERLPTKSLTAYELYQHGNSELNKASTKWYHEQIIDSSSLYKAKSLFYESLMYDSTLAMDYCGLADIYLLENRKKLESHFAGNYPDSVLILANKALSLDNKSAEAYNLRGEYYLFLNNSRQAVEEFDKAIEYDPSNSLAYFNESYIYRANKDYIDWVKAIKLTNKAIALNRGEGLARLYGGLGYIYFGAGFYDESKHYFQEESNISRDSSMLLIELTYLEANYGNEKEALRLAKLNFSRDPAFYLTRQWLANFYSNNGQYRESLKLLEREIWQLENKGIFDPIYPAVMITIAKAYHGDGNKQKAELWFNNWFKLCERSSKLGHYVDYIGLADSYAFLGNKEKALEILREFDKAKVVSVYDLYRIRSKDFDNIRNEPEFQWIVKNMEYKYQAAHESVRKWLNEQGKI